MTLEQIVPSFFLIAVLILILPSFIKSLKSKQFFRNLFIWSIIVVSVVIVFYLIFK